MTAFYALGTATFAMVHLAFYLALNPPKGF